MKKKSVAFQSCVCLSVCVYVCVCKEATQAGLQSCFVLTAILRALTIISL